MEFYNKPLALIPLSPPPFMRKEEYEIIRWEQAHPILLEYSVSKMLICQIIIQKAAWVQRELHQPLIIKVIYYISTNLPVSSKYITNANPWALLILTMKQMAFKNA